MLEAGHSRRSIGRQLHMTHRTVTSLADAADPEDLFRDQCEALPWRPAAAVLRRGGWRSRAPSSM